MVVIYSPELSRWVDSAELYRMTSGSVLGVTEESAALGFRSRDIDPESEAFKELASEGLPIYQAQLTSFSEISQAGQVSTQRTDATSVYSAGDTAPAAGGSWGSLGLFALAGLALWAFSKRRRR